MTKTIEQLTARVRELEEENARLKKVTHVSLPTNTMEQWVASEIRRATSYIKEQLAASQLREIQLRDALKMVTNKVCWSVFTDSEETQIEEALAQPTSTEALDAYVEGKVKALSDEHRRATLIRYEQTAEIIRQRDLAVEALEITVNSWSEQFERHGHLAPEWAVKCRNALSTIKESEK